MLLYPRALTGFAREHKLSKNNPSPRISPAPHFYQPPQLAPPLPVLLLVVLPQKVLIEVKKAFRLLQKTAEIASNPVGFVGGVLVDKATGRIIETDENGKEVPDLVALMMKVDRQNQFLEFIAEQMNPQDFKKTFRDGDDKDDEVEPITESTLITQAPEL